MTASDRPQATVPTISEEEFATWLDSHRTRQPPLRTLAPDTLTRVLVTLTRTQERTPPDPRLPPPPLLP
ncbi:hypothetical protein [Deinococcus sedimenti]|uniref:Uncharacterized protein n=1 Tax=Deinococcus sedimenti TaxID=1867090 RepID=A0ABQ2S6X2_9DEIO|nr:hypothetical protein [Deinococcus sedimenti]GGS03475.1 hypothetical protein GCM10008960_32620 [Deinococcus sedimenti]